jgi:alcohol dehydrogenase
VIDGTGGQLGRAVSLTAPDGICTSSGSFHRNARVPALAMYVRNITLHVSRVHARALMPEVLELIAQGRLPAESVITAAGSLDEAPALLREHVLAGGIKTVLTA